MGEDHPLQSNGESHVHRPHDILNLEIDARGRFEPDPFDDVGEFFGGQGGIVCAFGARDDHAAGGEEEGRGARFAEAHDDGGEASWVEFCVAAAEGDLFEV